MASMPSFLKKTEALARLLSARPSAGVRSIAMSLPSWSRREVGVPWRPEDYSFPELASFPVLGFGQSGTAVMEKAKCEERTKGAYDSVLSRAVR